MEFLLSLSHRAKDKLAKASLPDNANKSVMYADWTLSDEDVSIRAKFVLPIHQYRPHSLTIIRPDGLSRLR